jgi:hypothetical protein
MLAKRDLLRSTVAIAAGDCQAKPADGAKLSRHHRGQGHRRNRIHPLEGDKLTFNVQVLEGDLAGAAGAAALFIDIIGRRSRRCRLPALPGAAHSAAPCMPPRSVRLLMVRMQRRTTHARRAATILIRPAIERNINNCSSHLEHTPTAGPIPARLGAWRGGRVVECTALEMRHRCKPIGGSNPSLSATTLLCPARTHG